MMTCKYKQKFAEIRIKPIVQLWRH